MQAKRAASTRARHWRAQRRAARSATGDGAAPAPYALCARARSPAARPPPTRSAATRPRWRVRSRWQAQTVNRRWYVHHSTSIRASAASSSATQGSGPATAREVERPAGCAGARRVALTSVIAGSSRFTRTRERPAAPSAVYTPGDSARNSVACYFISKITNIEVYLTEYYISLCKVDNDF